MFDLIKAVIFDLDHTLFDRYKTLRAIVKPMREILPINPTLSDDGVGDIMINADKMYIYYSWDRVREHIVNETKLFTEKIDGHEYSNAVFKCFEDVAVPFTFTLPMLKELKKDGYLLGLITNGLPGLQEKKLQMLGLDGIFDRVLVTGQYGCPKPSLKPFQMMAEWLNLDPLEMMYVGDNPVNDIEPSRAAGYVPVYVNTVGKWPRPDIKECELQVETVAEIPEVVRRYNQKSN